MQPEQVTRIARLGGKAAHRTGTAHQWTVEQARDAGRKGGRETQRRRRAASHGDLVPRS